MSTPFHGLFMCGPLQRSHGDAWLVSPHVLREFLYVDVTRTRSLLAQLDEGVVEGVVRTGRERITWTGELSAWIAKGSRSSDTESGLQESKSMQDLVFTLFEEIAESTGLIRTVELDSISDPNAWETSSVHDRYEEGELLKVFTPVLLVDPVFLNSRFNRFLEMSERLNALNNTIKSARSNNSERPSIEKQNL